VLRIINHDGPVPCFTVDFEKNGSPFYESQFSSDAPISVWPDVMSAGVPKYTVHSKIKANPTWIRAAASRVSQ